MDSTLMLRPATRGHFRLAPALLGMALWLFRAAHQSVTQGGAIKDNDSWTHVTRLLEILRRGDWAGGLIFRDGAPAGYALHWTMPFDALVLTMAAPLALFTGWEHAVLAVAPLAGPVSGLLLILAMVWAVAPAGRTHLSVWAGIMVATAPPFINYGVVGNCDHHLLIEAILVAAIGAVWRMAVSRDRASTGMVAGALGGLALWTGIETTPGIMAAAGTVAALAVLAPGRVRHAGRAYALALAGATALALAIDRPLDPYTTDRLGPVLVLGAALAALVVLAALSKPITALPLRGRLAAIGIAGLVATLAWATVWRVATGWNAGFADPEVARWFWSTITEFRPPAGIGQALLFLGGAILATAFAAVKAWRAEGTARGLWLAVAVIQAAMLGIGFLHIRMSVHAAALAAPVLAHGLARLMERPATLPARMTRVLAAVAVVGLPFGGLAVFGEGLVKSGARCAMAEAARRVDTPDKPIVLTDINLSAPLLYQSRHLRTVSGPYHVNAGAMSDVVRFAADEAGAHEIIERRGVRYVLLCTAGGMPPGAFRRDLLAGAPPAWLERLPLTEPESQGVRLYRVVDGR